MANDAQRTEQPTPFRLRKAREEGRFPVSKELLHSVQFLLFVALLVGQFPSWWSSLQQSLRGMLAGAFLLQINQQTICDYLRVRISPITIRLLVTGAIIAGASLLSHLASIGFGFAPARLAPDFSHLAPGSNLKGALARGCRSFMEAICLIPLFMAAAWYAIFDGWTELLRLPAMSLSSELDVLGDVLGSLLWKAAGALLIWGAIDLWRQRRRYMRELRMTKQEIREENKQNEGNPEIKSRIRRIRRELLRRRMMSAMPSATAVVVNPTHFAVALRYTPEGSSAPIVVAKGKNYLALRIRERALAYQIPVIENPPLAQALYRQVEVGQEIPAGLYQAVAEVLAYVFRLMRVNPSTV
ncbi:MAG: EscU/YscU/HrcU family type III secretion system export apparatus switch protein [Fimbriimonadaceae bacterium]|nr:EscU/YscU/HrcU family type III secretion system export apparatus switch protein [Fimbriimonadaceae bacterium]